MLSLSVVQTPVPVQLALAFTALHRLLLQHRANRACVYLMLVLFCLSACEAWGSRVAALWINRTSAGSKFLYLCACARLMCPAALLRFCFDSFLLLFDVSRGFSCCLASSMQILFLFALPLRLAQLLHLHAFSRAGFATVTTTK